MILLISWVLSFLAGFVSSQETLGCYKSYSDNPDLPALIRNGISAPQECIDACRQQYYKYAAVSVKKCYCGSNYGRHGLSDTCNITCTDATYFCGSYDSINVFETGQKGPSPPRMVRVTAKKPSDLEITWSFPDIPNGELASYTIRATPMENYASESLQPFESLAEGGATNTTILKDLQPGSKYNISIVATNNEASSEPSFATGWTFIGPPEKPQVPKILKKGDDTFKVLIEKGNSENGPVSSYQVIVVMPGIIPPTSHDVPYQNFYLSQENGLGYYISGAFDDSDYEKFKVFEVGDGRMIGGYYNAPLNFTFMSPQIGLAVVSRIGKEVQYSYSDLTSSPLDFYSDGASSSVLNILLWMGIVVFGALLGVSVIVYFMLTKKYQKGLKSLSEHQELTLQGSLCEVDNIAYVPEDIPESTNHYQALKSKVWSIPRNFLTVDSTIFQRGRFGTVHPGSVQKDGRSIHVTIHSISDVAMKNSEKRLMLRELDACIKAGTMPNLAGLVGTCETPERLYVAIEKLSESLKNRLILSRTGNPFPADRIPAIGAGVASALQHLERIKVIHSCVCARTVGLDENLCPKLMGHGISKYSLESLKYARWTAIECFSNPKNKEFGPVWAFGVLLWEMFSLGGTPYANLTMDSDVEEALERGGRLQQLDYIPDSIYEVMLSCWQIDPRDRPTFDELVRLDTLASCPVIISTEPYMPELELNP